MVNQEQMSINELTYSIIGAAIEVHRHLGPGLLESTYQACLRYELSQMGLAVQEELALPVIYKGIKLDIGYRIDLLVENTVIIELKALDMLTNVHKAQTLTYLRLSDKKLGLLINFNVMRLTDGIRRIVNGLEDE